MAATSIRTKEWSLKKREVRAQRYFVCSVSARRGCSLRLIPGEEESLVGLLVTIAISVEATGVVVLADLSTPLRWGLYPGAKQIQDLTLKCVQWLFLLKIV